MNLDDFFLEDDLIIKREHDPNRVEVTYKGVPAATFWEDGQDKISLEVVKNALHMLKLTIQTEDAGGPKEWLRKQLANIEAARAYVKATETSS